MCGEECGSKDPLRGSIFGVFPQKLEEASICSHVPGVHCLSALVNLRLAGLVKIECLSLEKG